MEISAYSQQMIWRALTGRGLTIYERGMDSHQVSSERDAPPLQEESTPDF